MQPAADADAAGPRRARSGPPSAAQARIIAAALDLFARQGVGGTSLGMIANALGVTKAAVFHQFRTKDEIIVAAAEAELAVLESVLDVADAEPTRERAREVLVTSIVDLAVERRRTVGTILGDPVIIGVFEHHAPFRRVMHRLSRLLMGDEAGAQALVSTAVLSAAISGAVIHPLVADLDDATLRSELLRLTHRLFDLPGGPPTGATG